MKRLITWLNFAGVLAVAALCVWQWGQGHGLSEQLSKSEQTRSSQAATLDEASSTIATQQHDLDGVRQQLTASDAEATATRQKLVAATQETEKLKDQTAKIDADLKRWQDAVADRDKALKAAAADVQSLAAARDDAIKRYNELVSRTNAPGR